MALADNIIQAESGGDPNATNATSSAAGPGGFINSTWLNLVKQYRPDLAAGNDDNTLLGMRSDPTLSKQMVQAYADQNAKTLTSAGLDATPGNLYLAHFAGPQGAVNVLKASPDTAASDVMGPAATAANPFLKNMTIGQLQSWAAGKAGTPAPAGQTAQPTAPAPSAAPVTNSPTAPAPTAPAGGLLGLLNNPGAPSQPAPQPMPQPQQTVTPQPQAPAPQPLQITQGTPAAQAMRQKLIASIFAQQASS